jgi:hypothetical protein
MLDVTTLSARLPKSPVCDAVQPASIAAAINAACSRAFTTAFTRGA